VVIVYASWLYWGEVRRRVEPRAADLSEVSVLTGVAFPPSAQLAESLYHPFARGRDLVAAVALHTDDVGQFMDAHRRATGSDFIQDTFEEVNAVAVGSPTPWWPSDGEEGLISHTRTPTSEWTATHLYVAIVPGESTQATVYVAWRVAN
jgi:hypothetical protein